MLTARGRAAMLTARGRAVMLTARGRAVPELSASGARQSLPREVSGQEGSGALNPRHLLVGGFREAEFYDSEPLSHSDARRPVLFS